jgi:hypothetical protein
VGVLGGPEVPAAADGGVVVTTARKLRLTLEVVADDDRLTDAVEARVKLDQADLQHRRRIDQRERKLRALVGDDAWKAYLKLDEEIGARISDISISLVRWAFEQGKLVTHGPGEGHGR